MHRFMSVSHISSYTVVMTEVIKYVVGTAAGPVVVCLMRQILGQSNANDVKSL